MEISNEVISAEKLSQLARKVEHSLTESTEQIRNINEDIHVLSVNAKIESARAGKYGSGFAVVADNIRRLVYRTNGVTEQMESRLNALMRELSVMSAQLGNEVRGQRYLQIAYNAIDIIDRNLFERSCDVRWWATDESLVSALIQKDNDSCLHASTRLGIILNSYTVYLDLVLADVQGLIVANGRPQLFESVGMNVSQEQWFRDGMNLDSGEEFAEQGLHKSKCVNNDAVLTYSTTVRSNGDVHGQVLGVLGILFRWDELGKVVVDRANKAVLDTEGQDIMVETLISMELLRLIIPAIW